MGRSVLRAVLWIVTLAAAAALLTSFGVRGASAVGPGVSASPRLDTLRVVDGEVLDSALVGDRVILVGTFTTVQNAGGAEINQPYVAAYDIVSGQFDASFRPTLDQFATSVVGGADGSIYVGGQFISVDGETHRKVAKFAPDGSVVTSFNPAFNGTINDIALGNGELYVTGRFTTVNGQTRELLAALDSETGDPAAWANFDFDFSVASGGATTGKSLAISADGTQLWLSHTMRFIEGQERTLIAKFDLGPDSASLSNWQTDLYDDELDRFAGAMRPRRLAISPDGSYVVMTTSGGDRPPAGDTAVRFPTNSGANTQPDWISRHFDTVLGVAISNDAVFIGGHFQYQEAPGSTDPFPGDPFTNYGFGFGQGPLVLGDEVVAREQLGALDPLTGKSMDWNPGSDSFLGVQSLTWSDQYGLLVGHDASRLGGVSDIGRHAIFPVGNDPEPPPPPPPGDGYVCTTAVDGNAVVVSFSGLRGRSENLRSNNGWVATVTGLDSYRVANAVGDTFSVRVKGPEFADPFEEITCVAGGGGGGVTLETTIDAPANGTTVAPGQFTLQGEASAPGGVLRVRLSVANSTTGEYLRPDGTFTTEWTAIDVEFGTPTEELTWQQTLTITTPGLYNITAKTFANDGSKDGSRAESTLRIGATDDDPPELVISGPSSPTLGDDPTTLFGTAADDLGVQSVSFLIRNRDTNEYLRLDGTLGDAQRFTASLSAPGATFTNWTSTIQVPVGEWQATIDAYDTSGQRFRRNRSFSVAGDAEPPTITIDAGADAKQAPNTSFTFSGVADAPAGLENVQILVRDPLDFSGIQANGALGPNSSYYTLPGINGGVGASWSYSTPPLEAGTYDVFVRVTDVLGIRSTQRTRIIVGPDGDNVPSLSITGSTRYQQNLPTLEATITGQASDDNGVARVAARVYDFKARQWLQADGTLGTRPQPFEATLTDPGATTTAWSLTLVPPTPSTYYLYFHSIDDAGQLSPISIFSSARIYPGDALPTVTLNQPTDGQAITTNRINATGSANDDTGLARVEVLIRNTDTGRYLRRDGSFGNAQWITGALTNPGADRTNWDYASPTLPDGNYRLSIRAVDVNDQTTSPTTSVDLVLQ